MGKDFIGKRVRLQIGGTRDKEEDNAIVGEDVNIEISSDEAAKYDNIIGEKIELRIDADVDTAVQQIISAINSSDGQNKTAITQLCKEILAEQNKQTKGQKLRELISIGAGVASISQFILQLKAMVM